MALVRTERWHARVERGECIRCGYDMRSTPRRCPECGHVPPHGARIPFENWLAAEFGELDRESGRGPSDAAAEEPAELPIPMSDTGQPRPDLSRGPDSPHA